MPKALIYYGGFVHRAGGAFTHAHNLKLGLERRGWDVRLITLDDLPPVVRFLPHLAERLINSLARPYGFAVKGAITRLLYRTLFRRSCDLRVFEDIYLGWNSDTPTITVLHAVWSDNLQAYRVAPGRMTRLKRLESRRIRQADHAIITVSDPYRRYLEEVHFNGLGRALEVVELGIDQPQMPNSTGTRDPKALLYCGALEERKNVRFLLDAFEQAVEHDPGLRLTVIGDGADEARLRAHARERGLPVRFLGRCDREKVMEEMARHTLYVHPSVKESFSYALLEAKLAGLTTVAEQSLEVPAEFIDVPLSGYDPGQWAAAMLDPDPISKRFAPERFTIERMTDATLQKTQSMEAIVA